MSKAIDWIARMVRIAGVNFPVSAALVQIQSEIDSKKIAARIEKLEDPISFLHEDVATVSKEIYKELRVNDSPHIDFDKEFYTRYSRALAALFTKSFISMSLAIGSTIPLSITLVDPTYVLYMCALSEDTRKMEKIVETVETCEVGQWLDGDKIKVELGLPKYVIHAVFQIYEARGYGIVSKEVNSCRYMGNA